MIKQTILVRQIIHEVHPLFDIFMFGMGRIDMDDLRFAGDAAGHLPDTAFQRGREEQGLARFRRGRDDGFDVLNEAHVEHAVGFVEHQRLQL